MRLRTRILLSYGYLVTLLVASVGGAALAFQQLGTRLDRLLAEDYESVRSAAGLLEALERQDRAALSLLLGDPDAREALSRSQEDARRNLAAAARNGSASRAPAVIAEIRASLAALQEAQAALVGSREPPLVVYRQRLFPVFERAKRAVFELLEVDHQAMRQAGVDARRIARQASVALAATVALALLSLGWLSRHLQRRLLERLAEMEQTAEAIARGQVQRRVRVGSDDDELAAFARQLNAALDAQEDLDRSLTGRLSQQRRLLLGLLEAWPRPVAVVGLDGRLIASTLAAEQTALVEAAEEALRKQGQERLSRTETLEGWTLPLSVQDARLIATPLVAERRRPVGWLVSLH